MNIEPPWKAFDRIPWGSIGWRMGHGEAYWLSWNSAFAELSAVQKEEYKILWPEPHLWTGFYAFIEEGVLPPHHFQNETQIMAASRVPAVDEPQVTESDRVQWLLKNYLKKPVGYVKAIDSEVRDEIYVDPNGEPWLFRIPFGQADHFAPYLVRYHGKLIGEKNLIIERPIQSRP
jgi:hypothetical protein